MKIEHLKVSGEMQIPAHGDHAWLNITPSQQKKWIDQFPGTDVVREILKAAEWLERNKSRRPKTLRFMTKWLARSHTHTQPQQVTTTFSESQHPAVRNDYDPEQMSESQHKASEAAFAEQVPKIHWMLEQALGDIQEAQESVDHEYHTWVHGYFCGRVQCAVCGEWWDQGRPVHQGDMDALRRMVAI